MFEFYGISTFVGYLIPNLSLNKLSVLFQTIQFSISMHFISIKPIDKAISGATIPGQSRPGSNDNERVFRIPQIPSITGTSPSNCLVPYPGHSSVVGGLTLCRGTVSVFYNPSRLGKVKLLLNQNFPSSKLVAYQRSKNPFCPNIFPFSVVLRN